MADKKIQFKQVATVFGALLFVAGLVVVCVLLFPCSKDKFKLSDKGKSNCNSCGACRGIGIEVPVNKEYVKALYEDGILTENSFRLKPNTYL